MDEMNPGSRVLGQMMSSLKAHCLFSANQDEMILLKLLQGLVKDIKWSPEEVSVLFDAILQRFELEYKNDQSHLLTWMHQMLHCIQVNYITPTWRSKFGKTLLELVQDTTVTKEELQKYLADDEEKTLDEILGEIRDGELNQVNDVLLVDVRDIVSSVEAALTSQSSGSQLTGLKKDLLILCKAAEKTHFRPRLTQMVSWCLMALSKTGRLLQVATGEGKSCIVAMFAAFRAMRGDKVDIMSSSSVLAQRDIKDWSEFYDILKISVDCNINKQEAELKRCYESQVVYGTVEEFAGDWLKHNFHRMEIFGQRKPQCAIVDEVDSLMLDKGHHVVYLSSDMPALQHLNPLLALIWATASQYNKAESGTFVGPKYPFHQVILESIKQEGFDESTVLKMAEDTGVVAKATVKEIQRKSSLLNEKTVNVSSDKLVEFFRTAETRFPSCQFALHLKNTDGSIEELNRRHPGEVGQKQVSLLLNGGFCQYMYPDTNSVLKAAEEEIRHNLHFTPCKLDKTRDHCYIPGFLSELVECKLKVWIKNALYSHIMKDDHEYILEKHGIVPVDYSCTGVVENFMKWSDGLQQFLEMKHQSKLSAMTIITNYMSNVGLLQKYNTQIFGLSGTLGQRAEIQTIGRIYNSVKTCQIPSFKRRKLFEVQGVFLKDEKKWIEGICEVVAEQIKPTPYRSPRAVLVICETINLAKTLFSAFGDKIPNKSLYINNNMDNSAILCKTLKGGDVIIATNLAGRGTDLQVSDSVKAAGGLFVVQTFLPKNARVEAQAFGRAGRQGSQGSAQLIVCLSHVSEPLQLLILTRKLLSSLENILLKSLQELFFMQLKQLQRSNTMEERQEISSLLKRILVANSNSDMLIIKEIRDASVAEQLHSYEESVLPNIKKKEELFNKYLETLDLLYKTNRKLVESDVTSLHEFWGMWLLTKFDAEGSVEELKNILIEDLSKSIEKLMQRQPPTSNLHYYTAHGSELQKTGEFQESIDMYSKAINQDPCWGAVAYYNRAFVSLTQQNRNQDPKCLRQALEDLQKAFGSIELYCEQFQVTYQYATKETTHSARKLNSRFEKQNRAKHMMMVALKSNISKAVEVLNRAINAGCCVEVEKNLVYSLLPPQYFQLLAILLLIAKGDDSKDPLMHFQLISNPSFDIFLELRSFEHMGLSHIYELKTISFLSRVFSRLFNS